MIKPDDVSLCKTQNTYQLKGNSGAVVKLMNFLLAGLRQSPKTLINWLCLQASHTHDAISEAAQLMKEAVDDIMVTLNEAASEGGMVGGMVESIAESMGRVSLLRHWSRKYVWCLWWSNEKSAQVV